MSWSRPASQSPCLLDMGRCFWYTCGERGLEADISIKDTLERVLPYWHGTIVPNLAREQKVLIAAHGNSLRALVKYLDGIPDEDIPDQMLLRLRRAFIGTPLPSASILHERLSKIQALAVFCPSPCLKRAVVLTIIVATKFIHGAWIVILLIPLFVWMFHAVRHHYNTVAEQLTLDGLSPAP